MALAKIALSEDRTFENIKLSNARYVHGSCSSMCYVKIFVPLKRENLNLFRARTNKRMLRSENAPQRTQFRFQVFHFK
jgi:hypothetical protein